MGEVYENLARKKVTVKSLRKVRQNDPFFASWWKWNQYLVLFLWQVIQSWEATNFFKQIFKGGEIWQEKLDHQSCGWCLLIFFQLQRINL